MIRRPDTAVLVVIAFSLIALGVLLFIIGTAPVKSTSPQAWRPVPTALFSRWPAPVDAGRQGDGLGRGVDRRVVSVGSHPPSSILPSRPRATPVTGGLIPPYLGFRGLAGTSTWYAYHSGQAAAGRALRAAIGADWRGATVRVCHASRCLSVVLTDYESSQLPGRLIDLDSTDFQRLCGPLSIGVCSVEVDYNG